MGERISRRDVAASSRAVRAVGLLLLGLSVSGFEGCWTSADLAESGEFGVGLHKDTILVDAERGREIPIRVWYPSDGEPGVQAPDVAVAAGGPFPLIISAHGLGDRPQSLVELHRHLASHGFIVVGPKFPGSTLGTPLSDLTNDIVEHPADVSLAIDAALGVSGQMPAELAAAADPRRVGMMGLSFGGLATYLTSFDRELRDPRIDLAITLAGGGGDLLTPRFFAFVRRPLPLLLIHGTGDALVEFESTTGSVFENASWPTHRLALEGGTHIGYIKGLPLPPGQHPDSFACFFLPPIDPDDREAGVAFQYLASRTPDTGLLSIGPAALPCTYGAEQASTWMEVDRQVELTKVAILSFALSHFGETSSTRIRARAFLRDDFNSENPDAVLDAKPFSWDWFGWR